MALIIWIESKWFELLQTFGIIVGLLFNAHAMRREEQARRISNLSTLKQDYIQIWNQVYARPELARVLDKSADLGRNPVSITEWLFVKLLIIHLDSVYRAMKLGMFVTLEGLDADIKAFFSAPVPKAVWEKLKPVQNNDFVRFVEKAMS